MKHEMNYELEELEKLLGGVEEKKLGRERNRSIMERLDRKTGLETSGRAKKQVGLTRKAWFAIAACAVLVVGMAFGGYALAAEAKEYNAALAYCEANGISTEGLSRAEIKAVYRSIRSESGAYDSDTVVTVTHSGENGNVGGWEILTDGDPRTADFNSVIRAEIQRDIARQEYRCGISKDGSGVISKEKDGEKIWEYKTSEVSACCTAVSVTGGTAVFAQRTIESDEGTVSLPAVFKLNVNGELLWMTKWADDQADSDMIEYDSETLVPEPDGGVTVFSVKRDYARREFAVCVTRLDAEGNIVFDVENPVGNYTVFGAYKIGDGYIARIGLPPVPAEGFTVQEFCVMRFTGDGHIADAYRFSEDGMEIQVSDMVLFEGKLYVSAVVTDVGMFNERSESEELITAMLFVCDPDTGALKEFYQVKNAEGSKLEWSGNELMWRVNRITSLFFTEGEGLLTLNGTAAVWSYRFDTGCELIGCTETGESVSICK